MKKYLLTEEQMETIADMIDVWCDDHCSTGFDKETGEIQIWTHGRKNVVVTAEEVK